MHRFVTIQLPLQEVEQHEHPAFLSMGILSDCSEHPWANSRDTPYRAIRSAAHQAAIAGFAADARARLANGVFTAFEDAR